MALVRNIRTGTQPIVLHATGRNGRSGPWALLRQEVIDHLAADPPSPVEAPGTWAAFTWSTFDPGQTCLERCLMAIGAPLAVMRIPDPGVWRNILKIGLTVAFLEQTDAEYVVGLDATDVLVLEHPSEVVARFARHFEPAGCRLLFNAANFPWPRRRNMPCDACLDFELTAFDDRDRHLNAGCWVARRDYALGFWREVKEMVESPEWPHEFRNSEQIPVRACAFPGRYPQLDIDRRCAIFQHMEAGKKALQALVPGLTSSMVANGVRQEVPA